MAIGVSACNETWVADNYRMNAAFLMVGLSTESITIKISTSGGEYINKRLESKPENWATIIRHRESPEANQPQDKSHSRCGPGRGWLLIQGWLGS